VRSGTSRDTHETLTTSLTHISSLTPHEA
jgi:hypothetical protein